jgi:threonine/homoserine/homoserine lactone efflux protein
MTGDIELPTSAPPDAAHIQEAVAAEKTMQRALIKSVALAVPIAVAFFVGLVALAIRNQQPHWNVWLAMAAGIGVVAGVFFGLLAGFMRTSHLFK